MTDARSPAQELWIVFQQECLAYLRSSRLIVLCVLFAATLGGTGYFYDALVQQFGAQLAENAAADAGTAGQGQPNAVGMVRGGAATEQLLAMGGKQLVEIVENSEVPIVLIVVSVFAAFLLPLLLIMVTFDRIVQDVSGRYVRFIFQRVRRGSYIAGKYLAQVVTLGGGAAVTAAAMAVVAVVGLDLEAGAVFAFLPRIIGGLFIVTAAYVGLSTFCSTIASSGFGALVLSVLIMVFAAFAGFVWDPVEMIWIGDWEIEALLLDEVAAVIYLGWGGLFLGLSYLRLKTRDV